MMMNKRTFSKEEKLRIIQEASEQGVKLILEKYDLYPATYYSWKSKFEEMGEIGLQHGMNPKHLKRIRELEKENTALKQLLAEKELEGKLKSELLKKKVGSGEKKEIVNTFIFRGMKRDKALAIAGLSKHQYYYKPRPGKRGKPSSQETLKISGENVERVSNQAVVEQIKTIQDDPDTNYGYHKMTYVLLILGFYINHKKVYRLMDENNLLKDRSQKPARTFVKYRRVIPRSPLEILEMDIKFVWEEEHRRFAYVLTVLDTFTRVVLCWHAGYQIKQAQIKSIWEYIILNHLQPYNCLGKKMQIEIRNDNDSRFIAKTVQEFFKENHLTQVFTHPYTPQENGHIESFHAILSERLGRQVFWSLTELEQCLILFYEKYNNHRIHSSTCHLPPGVFWNLWEQGLIKTISNERERKIRFKLLIPYHQLSGNMNLREVPCSPSTTLDGLEEVSVLKEMNGAVTLPQPSVQ